MKFRVAPNVGNSKRNAEPEFSSKTTLQRIGGGMVIVEHSTYYLKNKVQRELPE